MSTPRENDPENQHSARTEGLGQPMYFVATASGTGVADQGFDMVELWRIMWRGRWTVFVVTALTTLVAVIYAMTATEVFRATVTLMPVEQNTPGYLAGQLGGLAALAGVAVKSDGAEALAVLDSREFARSFIERHGLEPVLLEQMASRFPASLARRKAANPPDIRDAVEFFRSEVFSLEEHRASRMVRLIVEWTSPGLAAEWANLLAEQANKRMRERALLEARANVDYLRGQLAETELLTLQESIGRLLESELQALMLAQGRTEFAFRVIDKAEAPKLRSWPKRRVIVLLALVIGGILGFILVLVRHALSSGSLDRAEN